VIQEAPTPLAVAAPSHPVPSEAPGRSTIWYLGSPRMPKRAIVLSIAALVIPVFASVVLPEATEEYQLIVWLLLLVPAFLMAYVRGWRGVTTSLAAGMVLIAAVQIVLALLGYAPPDLRLLISVIAAYICISLGIGILSDKLHGERMRAEELALTDELTALPNRRYVRLTLEREFAAARRGRPLVVVLFDLDRFKQYNDRNGHAAGDSALRATAQALGSQTRSMNISGRWGGEEFLAVLSSAEIAGALVFVERVKNRLRELQLRGGPLTVSCGLATFQPGMRTPEDLIAAADAALYEAKAAGSDSLRVFQAPSLTSSF
jgi:diguanylate cyclase (GGDEF)-like protein